MVQDHLSLSRYNIGVNSHSNTYILHKLIANLLQHVSQFQRQNHIPITLYSPNLIIISNTYFKDQFQINNKIRMHLINPHLDSLNCSLLTPVDQVRIGNPYGSTDRNHCLNWFLALLKHTVY